MFDGTELKANYNNSHLLTTLRWSVLTTKNDMNQCAPTDPGVSNGEDSNHRFVLIVCHGHFVILICSSLSRRVP